MYDGEFFSLATILLGFLLVVFLLAGGFIIYLMVTKMDQEQALKQKDSEPQD